MMYSRRARPDERQQVLELNAELRKARRSFALPDDSGHVAFQVPAVDYWWWTLKYPELGASDPVIARLAWAKFLNTDEGRPYKVNPHEGRRARVDRVIVK